VTDECIDIEAEEGTPAWLVQRRKERGLIAMPSASRRWDDHEVNPLTRDVAFNRHSMNDGEHVSPSDNGMMQVGTDGIRVALAQGIDEEAFRRTLSAATRATIGLDMTPHWEPCDVPERSVDNDDECDHKEHRGDWYHPRKQPYEGLVDPLDAHEDWTEMLKGGLQTALETQVIVFAVSGASRTATHQLVRSRRAAFHQQSQRASYLGDAPEVRIPESVWVNPQARGEFLRATMACWRAYRNICDMDISYQDARFVLQEGTTNFILLEYPVREFLNVYAYRGCSMFQWEIVHVMRECRRVLIEAHPWIEPYVKISCEKIQRCTFQGWEDVEGQCDFPWAKHELRTFKPEFHRIGRRQPDGSVK
jgi:hypothetical protein